MFFWPHLLQICFGVSFAFMGRVLFTAEFSVLVFQLHFGYHVALWDYSCCSSLLIRKSLDKLPNKCSCRILRDSNHLLFMWRGQRLPLCFHPQLLRTCVNTSVMHWCSETTFCQSSCNIEANCTESTDYVPMYSIFHYILTDSRLLGVFAVCNIVRSIFLWKRKNCVSKVKAKWQEKILV